MKHGKYLPLMLALVGIPIGCSYLPDYSSLEPSGVTVEEHRSYILLKPSSGAQGSVGLMFIPGGLVDPHAYVEALSFVAAQGSGYTVIIAKEPANLAVLNSGAVLSLTDEAPGVSRWAVGGHSLGGVMACTVVNANRELFAALLLEAAYPADTDDLSDWGHPVLSLSAEFDALATQGEIAAAKSLLPSSAAYDVIAGGCHGYFGSYGQQSGDGTPTITREAQQTAAAALIGSLLGGL